MRARAVDRSRWPRLMPEALVPRNRELCKAVVDHRYGRPYQRAPFSMTLALQPSLPQLAPERPQDADAVEALVLRAFGPGRYAKAAERLREGRGPALALSVVAWDAGEIVGCVRQWPVKVGDRAAVFLGPIAVDLEYRRHGLGAAMVERACEAAAAAGHDLIVLVGDAPFFGPLGFEAAPEVAMPGPVDQRRVMAKTLRTGAAKALAGVVAPA